MSRPEGKPGPPFIAVPSVIMQISQDELSFAAKCLYGRLRLHAGLPAEPDKEPREGTCYPGKDKLGKELGVSGRSVADFLNDLRDCGLISWRRTGRSSLYRIYPPSSYRADRKRGSDQNGGKVPIRPEESFRSDRNKPSDKKMSKRGYAKQAVEAAPNFGDLAFYRSDEDGE
jgi:hypothetical protein